MRFERIRVSKERPGEAPTSRTTAKELEVPMQQQSSVPAPPPTRETIAQKALRLYPERTVEPLGHGRYSVEGSDGFYEVDLAISRQSSE
jgi:hypothetical protein